MVAGCIDLGGIPPPPPDVPPPPDGGLGDGGVFEVEIWTMRFWPDSIAVPRGATVRWTNLDPVVHTVTEGRPPAPAPLFDCTLPGRWSVCEIAFPDPGEWEYFCRPHPGWTVGSRVVVR